jgi:hypothetical protein
MSGDGRRTTDITAPAVKRMALPTAISATTGSVHARPAASTAHAQTAATAADMSNHLATTSAVARRTSGRSDASSVS